MTAVRAVAPVRVADVGGWTDTWFGSPGRVCPLAVGPGVTVEATLVARTGAEDPVRLVAPRLGLDQAVGPDVDPVVGWTAPRPGRHPLLEHAVAAVLDGVDLGRGTGLDVVIDSAVPPGASLGTSAAVVVAVLAALDALVADGDRSPGDLAALAHDVETGRAGREAGVQDQWAAAFGGAQWLSINPYPSVARTPIDLDPAVTAALADRLVTVVFGAHDSSSVHGRVITDVVACSGEPHERTRGALRHLAVLADDAAAALAAGDLARWGAVLTAATEAQRTLHPALVGRHHQRAIEAAAGTGAVGWKVNGAGGDGGSLTVLTVDAAAAADLRRTLAGIDAAWTVVDLTPAPGVAVTPGAPPPPVPR